MDPTLWTKGVIVGDPTENLPFARTEAETLAGMLGQEPLIGRAATKAAVLEKLRSARFAHFATHAEFSAEDPFASGIVLADGERLTARELAREQLGLELAVASACWSGYRSFDIGDELSGLADGFLYAGVPRLIVARWPVPDNAAAELMGEFYRQLFASSPEEKCSVAEALRRAAMHTRQKYANPISWGAFSLFGNGW